MSVAIPTTRKEENSPRMFFVVLQVHCHDENCLLYLLLELFHCPCCDQHQFSPNTIHTLSTEMVRRIKKMIIKGKIFYQLLNSGEFVCGCWGLNG